MHPRRLAALALALVAATSVLVACGSDQKAATGPDGKALRRFTVVLDWTPNTNHAGMYLAEAKGWYEQAGLDVRFIEPGDAGSLQVLAAGRADVAVSVQEELIPARAEGLPVQSVAAILPHNTSSLATLASDHIERPRDLEGKTYGGFGGKLEEALIDRLVSCDGGDPKKVKIVEVGNEDYRIGLERNQYDAVWIFDGWDRIKIDDIEGVDLGSLAFRDHTDCIPDWYTPLLATSTKVEQGRAADLKAFLAATAKGYQAAMRDPEASAKALLAATDLPEDLVTRSARYLATRYADDPARWGRQDAKVWRDFSAFLVDAGLLDEPIDVDAAWTNAYLPGGS
jgi:ABC-type nitrate/sulfonate/bicarbonate transport system substrate-binding protein